LFVSSLIVEGGKCFCNLHQSEAAGNFNAASSLALRWCF
jgi:hypothetical protein